MSEMSALLNNLAAISQIIGAVAVVVTLLFIAVQIREARRIAAANSYQNLIQSMNTFYAALVESEDMGKLYWQGRKSPELLNDEQRIRFFYLCVQWFVFFENIFLQYSQGLIAKSYFESWCIAFEEDLQDTGFITYWQHEKHDYTKEFRNYVDKIIETNKHKLDPTNHVFSFLKSESFKPESDGTPSEKRGAMK